jgi:hypothetical protein
MTLDEAMNLVMILRRRIDLLDVELAVHKAALVRATSRIPVHPQGPREPAEKEVSYV